ncbi:MAG: hypothetical protein M1814_005854 [Vezdaea aestivalis]|nr:MAG: hypothetical protein M1814_005854 [Vezdaea aestivalis]
MDPGSSGQLGEPPGSANHERGRSGRRSGANPRGRNRGNRRGPAPASKPNNNQPPFGRDNFGTQLTQSALVNQDESELVVGPKRERKSSTASVEAEAESQFVIFTDDPVKHFQDFNENDFAQTDSLGIKYENSEIYEDTVLLLRFNCPDSDCDVACIGWTDLQRHVKTTHQKTMCDLCIRNKKVFTHEHILFTRDELRKHEKFGDDNPGAVDQSGFKGHPECGFCRQRFYGDDELYTHCRDKHERCHICDRRNATRQPNYYQNYDALEVHFRKDHHLCMERECLEKKFVVFDSEMDLKAHQLEAHPNELSKDARRDARRVDLSDFDYRTPHQQERGGRGRGRGRDPNADPLPQSTAQPLRRDELAYQRQMAIQSAQSVTARTFGGQLTSNEPTLSQSSRSQPQLDLQSNRPSPPNNPTISQPQNPQERARAVRHEAVLNRASSLLDGSSEKLQYFRNTISSYRASNTSAADLIGLFTNLFPVSTTELGTLIRDLADIYEVPEKREGLLKAWNDYRTVKSAESEREDYPALPLQSGARPAASGMRVLRLKSSTAQSSRSPANRENSWGSASPTTNPFPAMTNNTNGDNSNRKTAIPWAGSSASQPKPPATPRVLPSRPKPSHLTAAPPEAFPALPPTDPSKLAYGYGLGNSKGQIRANPWGALNAFNASSSNATAGVSGSDFGAAANSAGDSKKKGGKKKQILFHYG